MNEHSYSFGSVAKELLSSLALLSLSLLTS